MALVSSYFQLPTELEILDCVASRREPMEAAHFQLPAEEELRAYYGGLSHVRQLGLHVAVAHLAGEEAGWGEWHLFDDLGRLTRAIIGMKLPFWRRTALEKSHACLIASQYPLISDREWEQKVACAKSWELLRRGLLEKHPALPERAFKAQELFFLMFPAPLDLGPMQSMIRTLEALIEADSMTAEIVFDRLMTRESFRPTPSDIAHGVALKALEKAAREKIYSGDLKKSTESTFADVFYIDFPGGEGKFKPLARPQALKEAYGSILDRTLGLEMTVPTRFFQTANYWQLLEEVRRLFLAEKCRYDKFRSPYIPQAVRNAIFGEMYALYGKERKIDCLGEKLFYDMDGHETTLVQKARAIQKYFDSEICHEHLRAFRRQGSVQTWVRDCGRGFDLLVKDPDGGNKLKSAPKALVHLHALLGMLKGSMDGSSGNTFIVYSHGRVVNLLDFDDERSMPEKNDWWLMRLWQLGLPQCDMPFDRAVLLMFANLELKKLGNAQLDRISRMQQLFREELEKSEITLTPRELFFRILGGREDYERLTEEQISPLEIFEFHLPESSRGLWYTDEEWQKSIVLNNIKTLL